MKNKLRKIIVDGTAYLWAFNPGYIKPEPSKPDYLCNDQFVAFAEGYRRYLVHIRFTTRECPISGGPLRHGGPLLLDDLESLQANLHTPKWAAILIRLALSQGWRPQSSPMTLENGTALLLANKPLPL